VRSRCTSPPHSIDAHAAPNLDQIEKINDMFDAVGLVTYGRIAVLLRMRSRQYNSVASPRSSAVKLNRESRASASALAGSELCPPRSVASNL